MTLLVLFRGGGSTPTPGDDCAFQNDAFQADAFALCISAPPEEGCAFQNDAFQANAFALCLPPVKAGCVFQGNAFQNDAFEVCNHAEPDTGGGGIDPEEVFSITQGLPRGGRKPMGDLFEREPDEPVEKKEAPAPQTARKNDTTLSLDEFAISALANLEILQLEARQAAFLQQIQAQQAEAERVRAEMEYAVLMEAIARRRRQDEELALLLLLS